MKLGIKQHRILINLGLFILISLALLIILSPSVKASEEVLKAEMFLGDYEISKEKVSSGTYINKEVKYIETGSGKVIKERVSSTNTWSTKYYHTNHQGSTSVVTNTQGRKDTEFSSGRLRYFPYGEQITRQDINNLVVDDTYTGQKRDTETDLMFYNARLYNQKTGLFMQADSVNDGLNRYMYVGADPINKIDPSGKSAGDVFDKIKDWYMNNSYWEGANEALQNDIDYKMSSQYTKDMATIGGLFLVGVAAVYVAPAVAPAAMTYFVQAQQALGSPKAAVANAVTQLSDSVSGFLCALGSQFGCATNAITGPLSLAGDVGGSVGVSKKSPEPVADSVTLSYKLKSGERASRQMDWTIHQANQRAINLATKGDFYGASRCLGAACSAIGYSTIYENQAYLPKYGAVHGYTDYSRQLIVLSLQDNGRPRSSVDVLSTYLHEVNHVLDYTADPNRWDQPWSEARSNYTQQVYYHNLSSPQSKAKEHFHYRRAYRFANGYYPE